MKFAGHYEHVMEKTMWDFGTLKVLAKANNGMTCENLKSLYSGALEPIAFYGYEMWGHRMKSQGEKAKLMSLE